MPDAVCADCGHVFADRSETQWDVRQPKGGSAVVCSSCFDKRQSVHVEVDPDAPIEGSTAVLGLKPASRARRARRSPRT